MSGHYYVTTPIYYANGLPHIGSTYTTTLADFLRRFHNLLGDDTFLLTGTDEHGDKVQQAADAVGKTPLEFTSEVSEKFKHTWDELGLQYSKFIRTTDESHKAYVSKILQQIFDKGDIYFGEYGGHYCYGCERFLTDKELVEEKCPDHQKKPEWVSEKNYFFRMSKYQDQLIQHIKNNPEFIRPERYKNEVLGLLREPLEDLCISRPASRLTWGIPLPFDDKYVTYVWFDALVNYLSGIGYPEAPNAKTLWENSEHLIGKDIVKPHGVFWPTMLLAAEIPLYKNLTVHGYWNTATGKMSKSLGNAVDPLEVKKQVGMDVFRYFVLRDMTFGLDGTYSGKAVETRYNADLANNLGNLVSRSLGMLHKYFDGNVPKAEVHSKEAKTLMQSALSCFDDVATHVKQREPHKALARIWQLIDAVNVYIDRCKPWALAKEGADSLDSLKESTYTQLECIRIIAGNLNPFMPETSETILAFLKIDKVLSVEEITSWGLLEDGSKLLEAKALFPRLDSAEMDSKNLSASPISKSTKKKEQKPVNETNPKAKEDNLVSFDDFLKTELKVGQIIEAEVVEGTEKLLKLQVDLGEASNRQVVAGIAKHYKTNELVGRKVVVVANLKPAKLRGELSEGMILAASDKHGNLELVSPGDIMTPGSKIS